MGIRKGQNWMGNWGRVGVFANYNPPPHLFVYVTGSYLMFVCLGFIVPLENFSLICRRHHNWWRVANFDLCSALMAIEQWGFFSVPHLLWHGVSVYNYHLRGPVPLTPIAERLAVELSLPLFTISVCRGWDSNTQPPNALIHCATAAVHLRTYYTRHT